MKFFVFKFLIYGLTLYITLSCLWKITSKLVTAGDCFITFHISLFFKTSYISVRVCLIEKILETYAVKVSHSSLIRDGVDVILIQNRRIMIKFIILYRSVRKQNGLDHGDLDSDNQGGFG